MVKLSVCACCGHPLPESGPRNTLSPTQRRMYDIVLRSGTAGISASEIMNRLYEDRANGGPENQNIIPVMAIKIRERIEKFGITMAATRGHGSSYFIVPLYRKAEFEVRDPSTLRKQARKLARANEHV